jgi:glycosyltransferase involved in cell wall biosynthesis
LEFAEIKSKKILYLVTEDWYFWSHRLALAEDAKREGYTVYIVTNQGRHAASLAVKGFILLNLKIHRSIGSPKNEISTVFKLVKLYKHIKPDLVHHIALKPILIGTIAAWLSRVPAVVNAYTGLGYLFISNTLNSRIFNYMVVPFLALIMRNKRFFSIVQNPDDQAVLNNMKLIQSDRSFLIKGSGVDIEKFTFSREPDSESPIVLFASRLLKDKGIIEFIEAVKSLRERNVAARYVLVGNRDGANPTSISEEDLQEWIDQGIIEWWGYREDMADVFRQVHIVCLPSYREGLPKVLLEAAASGRPIVTTDVPGCREVVLDGVNGLLVPVRDHEKLADALQTLIGSPSLRVRMGSAGRARVVDNFSIHRVNQATLDLYNMLLSDDNGKHEPASANEEKE